MLFEGHDHVPGHVYSVIVGGDEADVHVVAPDVGFDCLGAFVVSCNHRSIVLGGHGADKDIIEVVNVGHKNVLHVAE